MQTEQYQLSQKKAKLKVSFWENRLSSYEVISSIWPVSDMSKLVSIICHQLIMCKSLALRCRATLQPYSRLLHKLLHFGILFRQVTIVASVPMRGCRQAMLLSCRPFLEYREAWEGACSNRLDDEV